MTEMMDFFSGYLETLKQYAMAAQRSPRFCRKARLVSVNEGEIESSDILVYICNIILCQL
jgi:hypothetical protein